MFAKKISYLTLVLALVIGLFAVALPAGTVSAAPIVVYDAVPVTLPPNMPSLGYQATQTAEFGDYIRLGGTNRELGTVTVTMSTWALHSTYPAMTDPTGWTHPITLNIYSAVPGTPNTLGSLLATKTQSFLIPWRPEADPTCATPSAWRASDSNCYNGYAFNITFDMASLNLTLPNDIIVGIAYNTNTWGYNPIGLPGPYESLNVGALGTTTFGSDDNTDNVFWNTVTPASGTRMVAQLASEYSARIPAGLRTACPSRLRRFPSQSLWLPGQIMIGPPRLLATWWMLAAARCISSATMPSIRSRRRWMQLLPVERPTSWRAPTWKK